MLQAIGVGSLRYADHSWGSGGLDQSDLMAPGTGRMVVGTYGLETGTDRFRWRLL